MPIAIDRKLLRWGNGYGIRLTSDEVSRLGLAAGRSVHAMVADAAPRNDIARLPTWNWGGKYDIDKILEEET